MPAAFHRIERLTPRGFLSFGEEFEGVELGSLAVLVGPNGSGKSNLMDAARFLAAAPTGLRAFLTQGGSTVADWCFNDGAAASVEVQVSGPGRSASLRYGLTLANGVDARLSAEHLTEGDTRRGKARPFSWLSRAPGGLRVSWRGNPPKAVRVELDPTLPVIEQIKDAREYPEMAWMRRHLAGYAFFAEANFGRAGSQLRQAQTAAQSQQALLESGANLPLIINALHQRSGLRQELLAHVREVYPFVQQLEVDMTMGLVQVVFVEQGRGRRTPASRLSDGTMRWLFLGALLLDGEANTPLFLDEPELALHPDAIIPLARLLKRASTRRQVVVSTHSDALLSEFADTPEVVHVFDRDQAGTRVTRLDATELQSWLKDHTLGEIWRAGRIGGNRW